MGPVLVTCRYLVLTSFVLLLAPPPKDGNNLTGQIPSELALMTSLTSLLLGTSVVISKHGTDFDLSLTRLLCGFESGINRLTGPIPKELASLKSLQFLHLSAFCFPC
jgi:hypothetical protein